MRLRVVWLELEAGDLRAAERRMAELKQLASGDDADMVRVLDAAILARRGEPRQALSKMLELGGRLVDPELRETWARAALEIARLARAPDEALEIMLAWRSFCSDEQLDRVEAEISGRLEQLDPGAKQRAFQVLRSKAKRTYAEESRRRANEWMLHAVRVSLGKHAVATSEGGLARALVADAPASFIRTDLGESLRLLAHSAEVPEHTLHAAIGLLLELDNDRSRREAAELVTGAMRALASVGSDEPVRLITREARSRELRDIQRDLDSLVLDGIALLIAGFSRETATLAAKAASDHSVAVITLSPPPEATSTNPFLFSIDSPEHQVIQIVQRAVADPRRIVRVGADDAFCRATEPVAWPSSALPARAELVVTADAGCASRLAEELRNGEYHVRCWLGPDAAKVAKAFEEAMVVSSPQLLGQAASTPVSLWRERFQRLPGWYEALGFDVTRLGINAIKQRGFESVRGDQAVASGRVRVRDALRQVESELMTTSAPGFAGGMRLKPGLVAARAEVLTASQEEAQ